MSRVDRPSYGSAFGSTVVYPTPPHAPVRCLASASPVRRTVEEAGSETQRDARCRKNQLSTAGGMLINSPSTAMSAKVFALTLSVLAACAFAQLPAPLITNVEHRTTVSLNGPWHAIVDPYDTVSKITAPTSARRTGSSSTPSRKRRRI